jgi:hypothetical protein
VLAWVGVGWVWVVIPPSKVVNALLIFSVFLTPDLCSWELVYILQYLLLSIFLYQNYLFFFPLLLHHRPFLRLRLFSFLLFVLLHLLILLLFLLLLILLLLLLLLFLLLRPPPSSSISSLP